MYASAQPLDFLDLAKNASFLNWKLSRAKILFLDGHIAVWIDGVGLGFGFQCSGFSPFVPVSERLSATPDT